MISNTDLSIIQKQWRIPKTHLDELKNQVDNIKMKHGMMANIPLVCRGIKCPYYEVCSVEPEFRLQGTNCLSEIGAITGRFEEYCKHFGIETENVYVDSKDLVDVSMIRDLIDLEVQILRAEKKIAVSSDFIAKHIAQVDKKGKAYYEDVIHPAAEYKLKLFNERQKLLNKLNATRKDKADLFKNTESYSQKAQTIIDAVKGKAKELNLEDMDEINNSLSKAE